MSALNVFLHNKSSTYNESGAYSLGVLVSPGSKTMILPSVPDTTEVLGTCTIAKI